MEKSGASLRQLNWPFRLMGKTGYCCQQAFVSSSSFIAILPHFRRCVHTLMRRDEGLALLAPRINSSGSDEAGKVGFSAREGQIKIACLSVCVCIESRV